jgi:hypothetical protein
MPKTLVILSIDEEFQNLCPPLDAEEREMLRQSICEDGCRDPIVYWTAPGNPIVDGMHRHEICQGEGRSFPTLGMEFPDRNAAKCWILRNQLGRRNLTDTQRSIARGRLYNEQKNTEFAANLPGVQNEHLGDTAAEIASEHGVSTSTVRRDAKLATAVDAIAATAPAVAAAIASGEIPAKAAAPLAVASPAKLRKVAEAKTKTARQKAVEAIANVKPAPPAEIKDQNGKPVPANLHDAFTRGRDEFAKALNLAKQLMAQIHAIAKDEIIGVAFAAKAIDKQAAADLGNVRRALRFAMPHAICPYCKAKGGACKACGGHGWVGERVDRSGREAVA